MKSYPFFSIHFDKTQREERLRGKFYLLRGVEEETSKMGNNPETEMG